MAIQLPGPAGGSGLIAQRPMRPQAGRTLAGPHAGNTRNYINKTQWVTVTATDLESDCQLVMALRPGPNSAVPWVDDQGRTQRGAT